MQLQDIIIGCRFIGSRVRTGRTASVADKDPLSVTTKTDGVRVKSGWYQTNDPGSGTREQHHCDRVGSTVGYVKSLIIRRNSQTIWSATAISLEVSYQPLRRCGPNTSGYLIRICIDDIYEIAVIGRNVQEALRTI